ncbi:MAG: hypothetical protein Q8L48_30045 [Archangium sp.]|nr:hypothetical protein [Archangium sp.]
MHVAALLASLMVGGVDLTNLWVDIPKDVNTVTLTSLEANKPGTFKALSRKVTVISFYSSFNSDGRAAQALDALARELGPRKDLAIYLVSIDLPRTPEELATLKQLVADLKVPTLTVLIDTEIQLLKWVNGQLRDDSKQKLASNEMLTPTFVIIRDGKILAAKDPKEDRRAAILKALEGR